MRIILGSTSPRRREILSYFSLSFDQVTPRFDEASIPYDGDPATFVKKLAEGKALSLSQEHPDCLILSADTIVYQGGKIYGKPQNEQEAFRALKELQGGWHSVYSGVAVWRDGNFNSHFEETKVLFNALGDDQIKKYLEALHWADKAGGYAIQLAGSLIVKKIEGCYYNVMGLPINTVNDLLRKMGIDLWDYLQ